MEEQLVIIGPIVHSEEREKITIIRKGAILVERGVITALEPTGDLENIKSQLKNDCKTINLEKNQFLCPGLVDTHIHAPQYPNIGLGYDKSLLEWLKAYTFPLEMKYSNVDFAKEVYKKVVESTLSNGTTTACYYTTIHKESSLELAKAVSQLGQRAIIGKVNMNQNSEEGYIETTKESLSATEDFIKEIRSLNNELIEPAVTPRFAISCDMNLLKGLGNIARTYGCHIQTHISENLSEVRAVKEMFPDCKSYTDVYDKAGLLTNKTILGHGVYLSHDECLTLSERGTSIAHCPCSNTMLQSGLCNLRDLRESGLKIGLGTDVSGGSSTSILEQMRSALSVSIHISFGKSSYKPLTYHEAFYLGTLGGAEAIAMENKIGNFKVGKDFDALVVQLSERDNAGVFDHHSIEDLVQKFIYCGDDRNIKDVYVKGKLVVCKNF